MKKHTSLTPMAYLQYVDSRAAEESARAAIVLPASIVPTLDDTVWRTLLSGKLKWLIDSSECTFEKPFRMAIDEVFAHIVLPEFIGAKKTASLKALYEMFTHVDGQQVFLDALKKIVTVSSLRVLGRKIQY